MERSDHENAVRRDPIPRIADDVGGLVSIPLSWLSFAAGFFLLFGSGLLVRRFVRRLQRINERLASAETRLTNVLEHSSDVIYQMNMAGTEYEYMSSSILDMIGYSADEVIAGGPQLIRDLVHPDDREPTRPQQLRHAPAEDIEGFLAHDLEFRLMTRSGNYIWVHNKRALVRDKDGNPLGVVGNVRDVTDKHEHLERINRSLKEKETLLAEVHHRVKNNLNVIISLIELQKEGDPSESNVRDILQDVQSRIHSISLVHEALYQSETFAEVSLTDYIEDLTASTELTFGSPQRIVTVNTLLDDVTLDITRAIPCGLIYNELITNVYKHAFTEKRKGTVTVTLGTDRDQVVLTVADDGVGLPADVDPDRSETLGFVLIRTLADQLNGTFAAERNGGTLFTLRFPRP